jgi:hypothetical protein
LDSIEVFVFLRQAKNFNCAHVVNYARAESTLCGGHKLRT